MVVKATASPILQLIRRAVEDVRVRELPDQDLVQRFHTQQDQAAFHALLRRHGPMVLEVCRGVLGNEADAEDAFQATFLILAYKAGSIRKKASLASWLHGVAYRTALKARAQSATRQEHEARVPARQLSEPDDLSWREVRQVLHEEVSALLERYRAPLVLCYLEGATQEAAAAQLKLAKSTLRERLERGRALLRTRLVRRGLGPAAVLVTASWPALDASACLPTSVVSSTIKAASLFVAGQAAAPDLISVQVAALTEGVLKTMFLTKLKIAAVVVLVVGALGIGASALPYRTAAAEPPPPVSKLGAPTQDQGNLKETVLTLEKRIWEAHTKQDVDAFKNLLADDFVGRDAHGEYYTKAGVLRYVSSFRVRDPEMKNPKVLMLSATSAVAMYEISYKVSSADGKNIGNVVHDATTAWAMRDGKWYYVYCSGSAREEGKGGFQLPLSGFPDKRENLDGLLGRAWEAEDKITDSEFIRRVYLDFRGTLPSPDEVTKFAQDKDANKRQKLVARLAAEELQESSIYLPAVLVTIDAKTSTITVRDATIEKLLEAAFLGKKGDQEFTYDWFAGREERKPATLVNLLIPKGAKITDGDKAIKVADLEVGMRVSLQLVVDKNRGLVVTGIRLGDKGAEKKP